jgi:hypothetical protein
MVLGSCYYVLLAFIMLAPCECTQYESRDQLFPSGASVASALLSGTVEWVSAIIYGITENGEPAFSVVTLIDYTVPIVLNIPPLVNVDVALRPITHIPYAEDFLRMGLNSTTNSSLARSLFPSVNSLLFSSGVSLMDKMKIQMGVAIIVVCLPDTVKSTISAITLLGICMAGLSFVVTTHI